jgi:hypothetical protein
VHHRGALQAFASSVVLWSVLKWQGRDKGRSGQERLRAKSKAQRAKVMSNLFGRLTLITGTCVQVNA